MPAAPPARRAPVGKVIHFFSDSPTQGYDGQKFSEAYQVVLKQAAESSQATAEAAPVASTSQLEGDKAGQDQAVKDEDVKTLVSRASDLRGLITAVCLANKPSSRPQVSLTGLSEEHAREVFKRAGSTDLTKACREYLHPSSSSSNGSSAPIASEATKSVKAVAAQ